MSTALLALGVLAAIGLPHALHLDRAAPGVAATIWLAALALRALAAVFMAIFFVLVLPATELFTLISHWCWHAVIPFLATHLPLNGHAVGDAALIAPSFVLAVSVLSVVAGLWRAARAVSRLIARSTIGDGPGESLIVKDGDILVAAAGLRRPRVLVSAGALVRFDDEELAASLDHERGHIRRHHRWILVAGELCRALGRFVPGTRIASRELAFHLERDADRFALRRENHPAALASAICKAAEAPALAAPSLALGGASVVRRVRQLLEDDPVASGPHQRLLPLVAAAMVALALASAAALPAAAEAGLHQAGRSTAVHDCPH
ncbi:MAG: M56 family metallopeptidase [Solirubrobacterales bacterium]|nr:M56 family metallopeptidase [Solirubrobacterales bacterium]